MIAYEIDSMIAFLKNEPSSLGKHEILNKYRQNEDVIKYLNYVYDEVNYVYGKSKLPLIARTEASIEDSDLTELYALVEDMNDGNLKGKAADQAMQDYCAGKSELYENLLFYIIKRDIKCKIGAKMINKVMGRVIPIAPYMRCEAEAFMSKRIVYETDGVKHGALAQTKADGAFFNVIVHADWAQVTDVACTTRYGRTVNPYGFLNALSHIARVMNLTSDIVIHGELLLKDDNGKVMNRQTGNGKINKYMKRDSTRKEYTKKIMEAKTDKAARKLKDDLANAEIEWIMISHNLVYQVWDVVPYNDWINLDCEIDTLTRFKWVQEIVKTWNDTLNKEKFPVGNCELILTDYKIVHSDEEAMEFYQEQLDKELEGMVIKNMSAPWTHDTNRAGIIKLKDFKENDLIIIGYNMADADSDFAGGIGSLIMESSDGLLKVDVSGMKRHERGLERVDINDSSKGLKVIEGFDFDQFTGKIAAVKYNEVIKSKSNDFHSMFLPNVLEIRDRSDKTQADSFDKIKKDAKYKGK